MLYLLDPTSLDISSNDAGENLPSGGNASFEKEKDGGGGTSKTYLAIPDPPPEGLCCGSGLSLIHI